MHKKALFWIKKLQPSRKPTSKPNVATKRSGKSRKMWSISRNICNSEYRLNFTNIRYVLLGFFHELWLILVFSPKWSLLEHFLYWSHRRKIGDVCPSLIQDSSELRHIRSLPKKEQTCTEAARRSVCEAYSCIRAHPFFCCIRSNLCMMWASL